MCSTNLLQLGFILTQVASYMWRDKIDPYTCRLGIPGHGILSDLPDP